MFERIDQNKYALLRFTFAYLASGITKISLEERYRYFCQYCVVNKLIKNCLKAKSHSNDICKQNNKKSGKVQ